MDREIKFRRAHFEEATGKFMYFSYWGKFGKRLDFTGAMTVSNEDRTLLKDTQYTGLKDCNGKEVFEGDVLRNPEREDTLTPTRKPIHPYYVVRYAAPKFVTDGWNGDIPISPELRSGLEVIGNIFENKDLLEAA